MKNTETGRSMVEMLGVLAIIGVLSVAGIAGYSMAMRKYKANEVLNLASQLRIVTIAGNSDGTGSAFASTDAANLGTAPSGVSLCSKADGSVKYSITDTKLKAVVADGAPDWLTEGTCSST